MKLAPVLLIPVMTVTVMATHQEMDTVLKGKVTQKTVYRCVNPSAQAIQKKDCRYKTVILYNNNGKQSKAVHYYRNRISYTIKFIHSDKGNLTGKKKFNAQGKLIQSEQFSYDRNSTLLEWKSYDQKGLLYERKTYLYNEQGKQVQQARHRPAGGYYEKWIYTYDTQGNKLKTENYREDKNRNWSEMYRYNDEGLLVETLMYSKGAFLFKIIYNYNKKKFIVEKLEYDKNNRQFARTACTYDSRDNVISRVRYWSDGTVDRRKTFSYDEVGNITVKKSFVVKTKKGDPMEKLTEMLIFEYIYAR